MTSLFAVLGIAAAACGPAGPTPEAPSPGEPFGLRVGESVQVAGAPIEVAFVGVSSDSRCPKDVQCVWEGDATVRLRAGEGTGEEVELHTAQDREHDAAVDGEYGVRLRRLDPEPVSDQPIEPSAYCAILEVIPAADASVAIQ